MNHSSVFRPHNTCIVDRGATASHVFRQPVLLASNLPTPLVFFVPFFPCQISALTEERNNAEDDLTFTQDNLTKAAEAGSMLVAQNQKLQADLEEAQTQLDSEKEGKDTIKRVFPKIESDDGVA